MNLIRSLRMAEGISWLQKGAIEVGGGMRQQEQGPFTHVYPLNPPPVSCVCANWIHEF